MDSKFKEPTANMKTVLLDLLNVVRTYDAGKAGLPHDVNGVHHMTLKAMAKPEYGKLILLDASYSDSPTRVIWTVAITRYGLQVAKKLSKNKSNVNDTEINAGKKKTRSLRTINWQVNVNQDTGKQVYEDAKAMKSDKKQSFTKTMNNLIALHKELKMGQVGLLQTLYPEAYATLLMLARNDIEMEREGKLEGLLEAFERHMLNAPQSANTGLNSGVPMGLRAMSHDNDDSGLIEVKKDMQSGAIATLNFLASMERLNGVKLQPPSPVTPQAGNPRVLAVSSLPMPVFEDD